jgi:hypothetical protein
MLLLWSENITTTVREISCPLCRQMAAIHTGEGAVLRAWCMLTELHHLPPTARLRCNTPLARCLSWASS